MDNLDIIVCGIGSIGRRHVNNLLKYYPDKKIGLLRREKKSYKNLPVFDNFEECIKTNPKIIFICTPNSTHMDYAIKAAKLGIHLFIEKPIDTRIKKVSELLEIIKQKSLICMIGFDLRFHPGILKIEEIIKSSKLGKIYSVECHVGQYLPDWHPYEDYRDTFLAKKELCGGILYELIHEIDYITYLCGDIKSIFCQTNHYSKLEFTSEDMAKLIINFKNGCLGYIHMDFLQRKYSRGCKIIGEKGTLEWNFAKDELYFNTKDDIEKIDYTKIERNERYIMELKYFLNCIEKNIKCIQNEIIGYNTLKIIDSAVESSEKNKLIYYN